MAGIEEQEGAGVKVESIRDDISMSSENFSTYRKRLIEDGVIEATQYGYLKFRLPGFGRYVRNKFRER